MEQSFNLLTCPACIQGKMLCCMGHLVIVGGKFPGPNGTRAWVVLCMVKENSEHPWCENRREY